MQTCKQCFSAVTKLGIAIIASISVAQANPTDTAVGGGAIEQADRAGTGLDYANAKPAPMPVANTFLLPDQESSTGPVIYPGSPGHSRGGKGDGKESPKILVPANKLHNIAAADTESSGDPMVKAEVGTSALPFTTSRVDVGGLQASKYDYYRRAGKLFFKNGTSTYVCSASLIKPGVVVTAAHCVSDFGKKRIYTNFEYEPAYYNGVAPYGVWTAAAQPLVMASYYNGTDSCSQAGVVCRNDVALIKLAPQSGRYPGYATGWYGYGWDGYGFTGANTNNVKAMITQLGYPVSHDGGETMQRNDAEAYVSSSNTDNSVIGSRMTGGSSGGPWLVNFGEVAKLSGTTLGTEPASDMVVGTTSWGANDLSVKNQGASPFTSTNITVLMKAACPTSGTAGCS
jgi:V8-like Glu-specific endopeptidase